MRLGEEGVTVLHVETGTGSHGPDWHAREALRALGVAPVRAGWYIVTVQKVNETHARETMAMQEWQEKQPPCNCNQTPAMKAGNVHSSSCARIGGED